MANLLKSSFGGALAGTFAALTVCFGLYNAATQPTSPTDQANALSKECFDRVGSTAESIGKCAQEVAAKMCGGEDRYVINRATGTTRNGVFNFQCFHAEPI